MAVAVFAGCTVGSDADVPEDAGGVAEPSNDSYSPEPLVASPERVAFNFFVAKGLTRFQSAGIVGNLIQESGVNPRIAQYGGGPGRGIAQWSTGGRWDTSHADNVTWYANTHGVSRWSLTTQLDFIWYELSHFGYGFAALRASTNVTQATVVFQDRYEICGACDSSQRIADAKSVLSRF